MMKEIDVFTCCEVDTDNSLLKTFYIVSCIWIKSFGL